MVIMLVMVNVLAEHVEPFIMATLEMAHASFCERGCRRFEVIREEGVPTRFILYKVFSSHADAELHLEMEHYKNWQSVTAAMLAEPAHTATYTQLF